MTREGHEDFSPCSLVSCGPPFDQQELREVMSLVVLLNAEAKTVNNVEDTADQGMTMGGKTNTEDERLIH